MSGPPTEQMRPVDERKPSAIRRAVDTRLDAARATVAQQFDQKAETEAKAAGRPLLQLASKLVRKGVGVAFILVGFSLAYQGLKPHDAWAVAGGALLMLAGFFAVAPDETRAFVKLVASAVFGWRSGAAPPSGGAE